MAVDFANLNGPLPRDLLSNFPNLTILSLRGNMLYSPDLDLVDGDRLTSPAQFRDVLAVPTEWEARSRQMRIDLSQNQFQGYVTEGAQSVFVEATNPIWSCSRNDPYAPNDSVTLPCFSSSEIKVLSMSRDYIAPFSAETSIDFSCKI